MHPVNVVVLQGVLARPAEARQLPSGDQLVAFEVTVRPDGGGVDTVPVVWHDAPPSAAVLATGTEVVVTGRVRRRFFRAGGTTQSRTEVVAAAVVPARHRQRARRSVTTALATLQPSVAGSSDPAGAGRRTRIPPQPQG